MKEASDINELYDWINNRYEQYSDGEITKEEYLNDLEYYKEQLAVSDQLPEETVSTNKERESVDPSKVRSTSIAGLRKKLMEEMKK